MARLPENAKYGWFARFLLWMARRRLGRVPTPWLVVALHPQVSFGLATMMMAHEKAHSVEPGLKSLARIQTARLIGCPF